MNLKLATLLRLCPRHFMLAGTLLLSSACQAHDHTHSEATQLKESSIVKVNEPSTMKPKQTSECHIISTDNWSARIETSEQGKQVLSIKGDIELPSPGYSVILEQSMADKSATPSQHFNIKTKRLDGMFIQMITPMTLEHSAPAIAKQYRSIIIHCGDQIIAEIEDVEAV